MPSAWSDRAWDEYLYWQTQDKKTQKKINELIKSIHRDGAMNGLGHPEKLKHRIGVLSREINKKDRLVYSYDVNGLLWIISCRGHYDD